MIALDTDLCFLFLVKQPFKMQIFWKIFIISTRLRNDGDMVMKTWKMCLKELHFDIYTWNFYFDIFGIPIIYMWRMGVARGKSGWGSFPKGRGRGVGQSPT